MANSQSNMRLKGTSGTHKVLNVQPCTANIKEEIIPNNPSISPNVLSSTRTQVTDNRHESTQTSRPQHIKWPRRNAVKNERKATTKEATVQEKYVISGTKSHTNTRKARMYVVRCYRYGSLTHGRITLNRNTHKSPHTIAVYCNRLTSKHQHPRHTRVTKLLLYLQRAPLIRTKITWKRFIY